MSVIFNDLKWPRNEGINYLCRSSACTHTNSNQMQHGSPSTEDAYFRVDNSPQPKGGRSISTPKTFGSHTYAHMVKQNNQILTGDRTRWGSNFLQNTTCLPTYHRGRVKRAKICVTPLPMLTVWPRGMLIHDILPSCTHHFHKFSSVDFLQYLLSLTPLFFYAASKKLEGTLLISLLHSLRTKAPSFLYSAFFISAWTTFFKVFKVYL